MAHTANENSASGAAHAAADGTPAEKSRLWALALGSLGVVYGDIGTSPLYAFREAVMAATEAGPVSRGVVLGVLSLILWALIVVVVIKYVLLLLRADNNGEGGTLSLTALASRAMGRRTAPVFLLGVVGASMFLGDAVITPAISVLSAIEGLKLVTPAFDHYVVPLTIAILLGLFAGQSRGTARVASFFAPVMTIWFVAIAAAGLLHIRDDPGVLAAINPAYAVAFLYGHGDVGLVTLGLVFLVVTGAEALYADLGHFGRLPIQRAWFGLVLPALLLNYFGQGAKVLADPAAIENPFYRLVPDVLLLPMVVLATAATVIASQAVITGAYSLVQQAIQLGFLPRLRILHTSAQTSGQIYVPAVNWILFAAVLAVVVGFGSSAELAQAYGVAVMGTMLATTFLTFFVVRFAWGLPLALCLGATAFFFAIEATLLSSALLKVFEGGWLPLAIGAALAALMLSWRRGRLLLLARLRQSSVPLERLLESLMRDPPLRVPGTAVFFTSTPDVAPNALLHNLSHNKVLHERVVFLTIDAGEEPAVPPERRIELERLEHGFWKMTRRYGFMQQPDVSHDLTETSRRILEFDLMTTTFFLSRQMVVPSRRGSLPVHLSERLFAALSHGASGVIDYFNLPPNRVIELGTKVQL
jgi:KUP system potassium uptake protein